MDGKRFHYICALALLLGTATHAQEPVNSLMITVGTTRQDPGSGDRWAYIAWDSNDERLISGREFAIYRRPGNFSTGGNFTRVGVVALQTDSRIIDSILTHSSGIGQDAAALNEAMDSVFDNLAPDAGALTLGEKVAAAMRAAVEDDEADASLALLARLHPGVNLALGHGFADKLPAAGEYVYEIRHYDAANDTAVAVVGRVLVDTATPLILPAPGTPVNVAPAATESVRGDLAVRLRWETPDALKLLSLAQYGFDVFRVTKTDAETLNFDSGLPDRTAFLNALNGPAPKVTRLNLFPLTPDEDLDANQVTNGDSKLFLYADDNRRFEDGGTAHNDGDRFYYYVAARGLLGQVGQISAGTLATLCDRVPPSPAKDLRVVSDYIYHPGNQINTQHLKLTWSPANPGTGTAISGYWVYRWDNPTEANANAANPATNRIAQLGSSATEYTDSGAGSPSLDANAGMVFYYTVRAVDSSSSGGNVSPPGIPVAGVLRNRIAPDPPSGTVGTRCLVPTVGFVSNGVNALSGLSSDILEVDFGCSASPTDQVSWVEYRDDDGNFFGRAPFVNLGNSQRAVLRKTFGGKSTAFTTECRVGLTNGRVSAWLPATTEFPLPNDDQRVVVSFSASVLIHTGTAGDPNDPCGDYYDPRAPGDAIEEPGGEATPPPGVFELRIYRTVNGGPLSLIAKLFTGGQLSWTDESPPANPSEICYYLQSIDLNGNSSEMVPIGCIQYAGTRELPTPMLAPIELSGTAANPTMRVRWFCPPHGVERFQLLMVSTDSVPDTSPSPELSDNLLLNLETGGYPGMNVGSYQTTRVAAWPNSNSAEFETTVPVDLDRPYFFVVTAVGPGPFRSTSSSVPSRTVGPTSNIVSGNWVEKVANGTDAPWPARPNPEVRDFHPGVLARKLPQPNGVKLTTGVRVGVLKELDPFYDDPVQIVGSKAFYSTTPNHRDPLSYIYKNDKVAEVEVKRGADAGRIFPCMLFRLQVDPITGSAISGDIVQVTPLMEKIPHEFTTDSDNDVTRIHDPFIAVIHKRDVAGEVVDDYTHDIYLLDRNPVVRGATYRYLLARYNQQMEIERIIPTNQVTITP